MSSVDAADLLFLHHLIITALGNDGNEISSTNDETKEEGGGNDLRSSLASLPKHRRDLVSSVTVLRDALGARDGRTSKTISAERDDDNAASLMEVEHAAKTARSAARAYMVSSGKYTSCLYRYWMAPPPPLSCQNNRHHPQSQSQPRIRYGQRRRRTTMKGHQVGCILAKQLIQQITLDKSISHQLIALLDDELYIKDDDDDANDDYDNSNNNNNNNTANYRIMQHKLYTWKQCIQQTIKIDTVLFGKLFSSEMHDEIIEVENVISTIDETKKSKKKKTKKKQKKKEEDEDYKMNSSSSSSARGATFWRNEGRRHSSTMTMYIHPSQPQQQQQQHHQMMNEDISLHERILSCISIEDVVQIFTSQQQQQQYDNNIHNHHGNHSSSSGSRKRQMMTSILLVGNEGCGKTYTLDTIEQFLSSYNNNNNDNINSSTTTTTTSKRDKIIIIRPNYIIDRIGHTTTIGSMEDSIISLFTYAIAVLQQQQQQQQQYFGQKCIIILDDIDKLFALLSTKDDEFIGNDDSNNSTSRCKALFVSILDIIHDKCTSSSSSNSLVADDMNNDNDGSGHLLLICTVGSHCVEVVDRFDRIFTLDRWEEEEDVHQHQKQQKQQQRQMMLSCLSSDTSLNINDNVSNGIDAMVSRIVHHTIGKRVCELAQICREVLLRDIIEEQQQQQQQQFIITHSNDAVVVVKRRLQCLDNILQTITPQSIRSGNLDGVVDVRVVTPKELQSLLVPYTVDGTVHLPLLGIEAKRAYDELMNVIVIPLCRSDEIHALLYDGGGGGDHDNATRSTSTMRVGALLAGNPGVGKTTLAYHCAAMAATMMSTNNRGVTLLDVSATSLIHKEIGSSERAVHSLFVAVRAAAPCILLIDGIDSVALRRGNDNTTEGTMDRVLSTFLTELDGIEEMEYSGGNVAVIGITHHPNLIDPALIRPGRLEKVITLGGLDYEARKEIVLRQIEDCAFDFTTSSSSSSMDDYSFNNSIKNKNDIANFVAYQTTNMSAVEVIAICREASMVCLRELNFDTQVKPSLTYNHFQRAIVIMKGKK